MNNPIIIFLATMALGYFVLAGLFRMHGVAPRVASLVVVLLTAFGLYASVRDDAIETCREASPATFGAPDSFLTDGTLVGKYGFSWSCTYLDNYTNDFKESND